MKIFVIAYRRPLMLTKTIESILTWSSFSGATVIVDAPGDNADELNRQEVIRRAEEYRTLDPRFQLKTYTSRVSFQSHASRVHEFINLSENRYIVLEEDTQTSADGLDFYKRTFETNNQPKVATAYSPYGHTDQAHEMRKSIFPQLWGGAFNSLAYEEYKKTIHDNRIDQKLIHEIVDTVFVGRGIQLRDYRKRLKSHLTWYFNRALLSAGHPDVLFWYSQMRAGLLCDVSNQNYVIDLGAGADGGMNPRARIEHLTHNFLSVESNHTICVTCEKLTSRIEPNIWKNYPSALARRIWRI